MQDDMSKTSLRPSGRENDDGHRRFISLLLVVLSDLEEEGKGRGEEERWRREEGKRREKETLGRGPGRLYRGARGRGRRGGHVPHPFTVRERVAGGGRKGEE